MAKYQCSGTRRIERNEIHVNARTYDATTTEDAARLFCRDLIEMVPAPLAKNLWRTEVHVQDSDGRITRYWADYDREALAEDPPRLAMKIELLP